jgi:hypothetical protein
MKRSPFLALPALSAAAMLLIVTCGISNAALLSPAGFSRIDGSSSITLVQDKKKSEPIKEKVKRIWRNMTGYKFDVGCPALVPLSHKTCTATGKNSADARAKCQAQNALYQVKPMK